jgi:alpha-glucosidase
MSKRAHPAEFFYGLGDKPMQLNLRGKKVLNWNHDNYGFPKDADPLYKSIPFYLGLHNGTGYGIFFDNTFKSTFDFGADKRDICTFAADGGEMNYYFIYGPSLIEVVENYTHLTGKPELPPLWALGYHQCKWSYYPESQVKEIAAKMREEQIPCDALYLDIDYMNEFRCFTFDTDRFPDAKRMVGELKQQGFKTIVMIDPGIKIDKAYQIYNEAIENGYFVRRADGPLMKGKVWPGDCHFPDFTHPAVREWWAGLYKEFIQDIGIAGVWNDMNEPALFEVDTKTAPHDARHNYDGNPCSHRKAHNIYGMQMARSTYHGLKKAGYPNRPFVITRAAYSGAQRYASAWTGDNIATWEHLWVANMQIQRMAVSGFSFVGSDIGGFTEHPSSELYVRWIQSAVFHPFMRTHSSGEHGNQEPYSFGKEATDIIRKFIELRYQLLPYLYTTFWQYTTQGTPMVRPLTLLAQDDTHTHYRTDEYCYGDNILVCPIMRPTQTERRMYLPIGKRWYNYWTDQTEQGGYEFTTQADLNTMPIYIKEGAVVPMYPAMQYVGEHPITQLTLHVYYTDGEATSELYEDAGNGYAYRKNEYSHKKFKVLGKTTALSLMQIKSGKWNDTYNTVRLVIHGLPFEPKVCKIDKEPVEIHTAKFYDADVYVVEVKNDFSEFYCRQA